MPQSGVLLVTGASRGIGAATATLAAARGYSVAVNYKSDANAAERIVANIAADLADTSTGAPRDRRRNRR